jgi:uroporphyrin-III C-methyltransferase
MNQETQVDTVPSEAAAEPASAPASVPARPVGAGVLLAVLALLVALAAGGGAVYLWRQDSDAAQALQLVQSEVEQLQAQQRERDTKFHSDLAALHAQQKAHQDALDALHARQDQTHTRSSREWTLREAEYLMQIANQRLQLERDVTSAIVALTAADERLRELAEPGLLVVRRQLAGELNALRAVPSLDREGMVLELISYAQRVDQLPLANAPPKTSSTSAPSNATTPATRDWHVALDAAWQSLKRLVVVRRDSQPVQPMLAPEQEYFLRQNLRLQLEAARVALLRDDPGSFKAGLDSATSWLKQYFDTSDKSVSSAIDALHDMTKLNIRPTLPAIDESLRLLRLQLAPERVMEGMAHDTQLPGLRTVHEGRRAS